MDGASRRVCYSVAASLDGYIAGPAGEHDWIVHDPDIDFGAFMARFDAAVMGRRTYEKAAALGGAQMPGLRTYIASRTLTQAPEGTTLLPDAVAGLEELRAAPGKDIWLFGGGDLFRGMLDAGQVDEVEVAVIPVLLGGGLPLLASPAESARLRLTRQHLFDKSGIVWLTYDVL